MCAAWINCPQMETRPQYPGLIDKGDKSSLFLCFPFFHLEDIENWTIEEEGDYKPQ